MSGHTHDQRANSIVGSTLGPVMMDLKGSDLDQVEKEMLAHPHVGGLIYFTRNFEDHQQITELTQRVREVRPEVLIAVDHEGGRVQRFREGFTRIPPMAVLGEQYNHDSKKALQQAHELAWLLAAEVLALGIDISFAPVLDVDYGGSEIIGDRAFHQQPEIITEIAGAFIQGMKAAGMASTGKHFPGHGYVAEDSHIAKPIDRRSLDDIMRTDMQPFQQLAQAGLDAVMPAHVVYEQVDDKPAGFSKKWIQGILRAQLKFDGVAFSDDLSMDGADLGIGFTERGNLALDAGCDMVLVCNNSSAAEQVIESIAIPSDWSDRRIQTMRMQQSNTQGLNALMQSDEWNNKKQSLKEVLTA